MDTQRAQYTELGRERNKAIERLHRVLSAEDYYSLERWGEFFVRGRDTGVWYKITMSSSIGVSVNWANGDEGWDKRFRPGWPAVCMSYINRDGALLVWFDEERVLYDYLLITQAERKLWVVKDALPMYYALVTHKVIMDYIGLVDQRSLLCLKR